MPACTVSSRSGAVHAACYRSVALHLIRAAHPTPPQRLPSIAASQHSLRLPCTPGLPQGRMTVPLERVIQQKRVRDTWALRDSPSGRPSTLTAEFRWLSTMAAAADVRPF